MHLTAPWCIPVAEKRAVLSTLPLLFCEGRWSAEIHWSCDDSICSALLRSLETQIAAVHFSLLRDRDVERRRKKRHRAMENVHYRRTELNECNTRENIRRDEIQQTWTEFFFFFSSPFKECGKFQVTVLCHFQKAEPRRHKNLLSSIKPVFCCSYTVIQHACGT